MTQLRQRLLLHPDVELVGVGELDPSVQEQLGADAHDVAVSRRGARQSTKVVDVETATLLRFFRKPETIPRAVARFSSALGDDPKEVLDGVLPVLAELVSQGVLIPEGMEEGPGHTLLGPGAEIAGFTVTKVLQSFEDSAVLQAQTVDGSYVALKVASEDAAGMDPGFRREGSVLRRLGGRVSPEVVAVGSEAELTYLATQWIQGAPAPTVAATMRRDFDLEGLHGLLVAIAEAYATIHEAGVAHGDVHPGNVLVDVDDRVWLIDFGVATTLDDHAGDPSLRAGVAFYADPATAAAQEQGLPPPPVSVASEQFSLAALLYELATGQHHVGYFLDEAELLDAIVNTPSRSFAEAGAGQWDELEAVLHRALAKAPEDRYPSSRNFVEAVTNAAPPPSPPTPASPGVSSGAFVDRLIAYLAPDGELYAAGPEPGPKCSVAFGSSGIAYGLYRFAIGRDDPALLAAAHIWLRRTWRDVDDEWAFSHPSGHLSADDVPRYSIFHREAGISLVGALIDLARNDPMAASAGIAQFLADSALITPEDDDAEVALGRMGTVLGAAHLIEAVPTSMDEEKTALSELARPIVDAVWQEVGSSPARLVESRPNLGLAHGWSGILFATARWSEASGDPLPEGFWSRVDALRDEIRPSGRGRNIPWNFEGSLGAQEMPGWCNGSAGVVLTLVQLAVMSDSDELLDAARQLVVHTHDAPEGLHDFCCGVAGRAYALAEYARASGEHRWLEAAIRMADRAVDRVSEAPRDEHPVHSFHKGDLGLALLLDDLRRPERLTTPMMTKQR